MPKCPAALATCGVTRPRSLSDASDQYRPAKRHQAATLFYHSPYQEPAGVPTVLNPWDTAMTVTAGPGERLSATRDLTTLELKAIYDADPRPTFIVDTSAAVDVEQLGILYSNPALSARKDLRLHLSSSRHVAPEFRTWVQSSRSREHYYRAGGTLWFGFLLDGRWKVVSSVPTHFHQGGEAESSTPSPNSYTTASVANGFAPSTTITNGWKVAKSKHEPEHGQMSRDRQSTREGEQRVQGELQSSESLMSRTTVLRSYSDNSIPTVSRYEQPETGSNGETSRGIESVTRSTEPPPDRIAGRNSALNQTSSNLKLPVKTVTGINDTDAISALEKFQRLAEAVDVGFFDYDLSGRLLHANESWYALSGHPREPEAHTTLSFNKCVYPDDMDLVMKQWTTLLKGQPVTFEMRWKRPLTDDASEDAPYGAQWVLSACVPVIGEDGEIKSISGCTTDINAQKLSAEVAEQRAQALERARASEERFARFAAVAPIAIFRFDKHKNIEYCNDRWFEMTGIEKGLFEDIQWPFGVHEEDIEMCSQAWDRAIVDHSIGQIEFRLRKEWHDANGRRGQAWVYCTFFPEFSEDGSFNGLMGSLLDISHIKWAENMQKLRAEEALEAKRQQENFIDITSHEMRNPLSAMVQCADSIMTSLLDVARIVDRSARMSDAEEQQMLKDNIETGLDATQTILSCAAHQKRIVDDILTLSKLDSNLLLITPVKTDPVAMVQSVVKMFEMDSSKAGLELVRELDSSFDALNLQWLTLDPSRVSQILINLLGNAIKFTKSEETRRVTVRMSASLEPPSKYDGTIEYVPAESIMDDSDGGSEGDEGPPIYLMFQVQDTGRGLTPEEKDKLFMRFSQASPKTHVQYGGSGLGLFISRKLTEMQGGEIGFDSKADVGSTFAFYVKTRRTTAPAEDTMSGVMLEISGEAIDNHRESLQKNINVLLVEDNVVNQKVLSKQLKHQGCTVYVAGHGVEALDFLRTTQLWTRRSSADSAAPASDPVSIDVVLMDIEMPIMGGLECTRKIRELENSKMFAKHLPIISISANARQEQVDEARSAGVDDTITKPFRIKELMPKLVRLAV